MGHSVSRLGGVLILDSCGRYTARVPRVHTLVLFMLLLASAPGAAASSSFLLGRGEHIGFCTEREPLGGDRIRSFGSLRFI